MKLDTLFKNISNSDWEKDGHHWPPDAFAFCATALLRSGTYTRVVAKWPPNPGIATDQKMWASKIAKIGERWRLASRPSRIPKHVLKWWELIKKNKGTELHNLELPKNAKLVEALIQICAAADEASAGIGLSDRDDDGFDKKLSRIFIGQLMKVGYMSTVCDKINANYLRVLPKLHTPGSGITIRSLSHHLALCPSGEVIPQYWPAPNVLDIDETMNLLVVPWPNTILPSSFSECKKGVGPLFNMPDAFGFFRYEIPKFKNSEEVFGQIVKSAPIVAGDINGVIFPEMALKPGEIAKLWNILKKRNKPCFLISGTCEKTGKRPLDNNKAVCNVPVDNKMKFEFVLEQSKHHRWRLDKSQLQQYSLSTRLSTAKQWWEASNIPPRNLQFVKLSPYAVMSFLICEDLARQDPIADLVRSVGPNIVIALLMDGPQLSSRWSSRYATVLADDPGCSVLTLTSIGMARMSKCLGKPESRVVALWKDSKKGPFEIELPFDAEALVLSLRLNRDSEWTADGRCAENSAGRWELESVHPVRLDRRHSIA